jgi:hypothetical protein
MRAQHKNHAEHDPEMTTARHTFDSRHKSSKGLV